jgi:hypothetical protein
MRYEDLLVIIVLSFVVSPICLTVTKTTFFKPVRVFIKSHSKWLGKLFSCPYCFSHWTSFAAVAVFKPVVISCGFFFLIDYAVSAFVMIALANLISGLIFKSIASME